MVLPSVPDEEVFKMLKCHNQRTSVLILLGLIVYSEKWVLTRLNLMKLRSENLHGMKFLNMGAHL